MSARKQARHLRSGSTIRSPEKDIEILDVQNDLTKRATRLKVRSDSGEEYTLLIRDRAESSACSCKGWIFAGARKAKARGWPKGLRVPCTHIDTVFANVDTSVLEAITDVAQRTASLQKIRRGRFELIHWNK